MDIIGRLSSVYLCSHTQLRHLCWPMLYTGYFAKDRILRHGVYPYRQRLQRVT